MSFKSASALALAVSAIVAATTAHSATQYVVNGDFETNGGLGQLTPSITYATGWTSATPNDTAVAFNFIVDTTADNATSGFTGGFPSVNSTSLNTNIFVWGPDNGSSNGFTGSPNGGYFLGADGGYATAAVSQNITGLTSGTNYVLTFFWAASQFTDAVLPTSQGWQVTFGGDTASTGMVSVPGKGFVGWNFFTHTFAAQSASQTLSFLAQGARPNALPPFALLDGVSLTEENSPPPPPGVPEIDLSSSTGGLALLAGLLAVAAERRRRKTA